MAHEQLAGHPLMAAVHSNLRPLVDRAARELEALAQRGVVRSKAPPRLLEFEFYDYDVSYRASAVVSAVERLKQSQEFIKAFPRPRTYERRRINQHTWIEYHYSHFAITFVSLFDIALLLTNSVFRLGNRGEDCREHLIRKNRWVARTPVNAALRDLKKLIEPHKAGRNHHVHWGEVQSIAAELKSDDLDRLELISFARALGGPPIIDARILDLAYKGHVKEICRRLEDARSEASAAIVQLFDRLLPIYTEKSNELREKWRKVLEQELEHRKNRRRQAASAS